MNYILRYQKNHFMGLSMANVYQINHNLLEEMHLPMHFFIPDKVNLFVTHK